MTSGSTPWRGGGALDVVAERYDRVARLYSLLEPLYLIFPPARRRAVLALGLREGDTVLEVGVGSGRNLPYLVEAVGSRGRVIGVDASPGMLAEARRLVERNRWVNIELLRQDAAHLELEEDVSAVLFALSYSVIPNPKAALARAWERLLPGGRVVVMDLGLTQSRLHRLLHPLGRLLVELAPGDPYSEPWADLGSYGQVRTRRFMAGLFYVSSMAKAV
jgi:demethylmenaquinone methyltransferase/2-methoxy-6-polyprenyl-1,4-benzoquinol methylase